LTPLPFKQLISVYTDTQHRLNSCSLLEETNNTINKHPTDCHAQLAATCLFTPTVFEGRFWPVK